MATVDIPIGCQNPGLAPQEQLCCYSNNQTQHPCQTFIGPNPGDTILASACPSGNCLKDCQNPMTLYGGVTTEDSILNTDTIRMYMACVAVPAIAGYEANDILLPDQATTVRQFIPPEDATEDNLRGVTATVTECLTQTCLAARNGSLCYDQYCAPTKLLINGTMPNQTAISQCLYTLCSNGLEIVPFANSDIIGIGIFSSYVLQLLLVSVLWLGLVVRSLVGWRKIRRPNATKQAQEGPAEARGGRQTRVPRESWLRFLLEFHKAQCYFAGTLMIAIFVSGIIKIDVAMIYLLLPLTMNGVVPVVFAYIMLVYNRACSSAITFLTVAVYILSTVAFWILYINLRSLVTTNDLTYNVFAQYMYGISSIDTCGGLSALAACPDNLLLGREKAIGAIKLLRFIPPLVWSISTAILLGVLTAEAWTQVGKYRLHARTLSDQTTSNAAYITSKTIRVAFWLTTFASIGCVALQMSLLSITLSLDMFDAKDWGFGQVVAVTIWVPPVFDYLYVLLRKRVIGMRK